MSSTLKKGYNEYIIKYNYTMYIYKTTNHINNKIYIGLKMQSVESSVNYYGSGTYIKHAIKKYGKENFSKEIIERDIIDRAMLYERERYWVAEYNSKDKSIGYNLTDGGRGPLNYKHTKAARIAITEAGKGRIVSEESRRKASESMKALYQTNSPKAILAKANIAKAMSTRIISDETRSRMKAGVKKRPPVSDETKARMAASARRRLKL